MKKTNIIFCSALCAMFSLPGFAAGTYYTGGGYQSPQQRYGATGTSPSAYAPTYSNQYNSGTYQRPTTSQIPYQPVSQTSANAQGQSRTTAKSQGTQQGFYLTGGISRQSAEWEFEMKQAGSKLQYTNLAWNVLDVNLGYAFGKNAMGLKIDAGLTYGMQAGESPMIDDDISKGGYLIATYYNPTTGEVLGDVYGHALSVGTSKGGDMLGFNIGLGLTDKFAIGKMKITPSVGYRMMSYSLTTENNFGMSLDTGWCVTVPGSNETQCDPFILVIKGPGQTPEAIFENKNTTGGRLDTGGTYYYSQPGVSHNYNVSWNGPYLAVDLDYEINENNSVSARMELGLPAYTAEGDQPYRPDWKHPKSVEDTAGIGDSYHLGLAALWSTAISKNVSLQIGLTYDYYTMSGASAKTFLTGEAYGIEGWPNGTSYDTIFWDIVNNQFGGNEAAALDPNNGNAIAIGIRELKDACPGWICTTDNEVDSFYKSMGIRVGLAARF